MSNPGCGWFWRISLDEAGLARGSFHSYYVPPPDHAAFVASSVEMAQSEGGQALHGYASYEMLWEEGLAMEGAYQLKKFVDAAKAGIGLLYFTIFRNDALYPGGQWIDIHCRPHFPRQAASARQYAGSSGQAVEFVTDFVLRLNNIFVINDPSLYTT